VTWQIRPLSEVAEVRLGRQRSPKNHYGDSMRPYLRAANVTWSGLSLDDVKSMNFTDEELATYRLEPGDIVLSEASGSAGEVGKPALWSGEIVDCAFQNTLIRVRPREHEPKFLLHYFRYQALVGRFVQHSRGVGIHHLGRARLASWPTPVPPLSEQRRIIDLLDDHLSRLDAATDLVDKQRMRLAGLSALHAHHLTTSNNGTRQTLADISQFITDGDHNPPKRVPAGVPHVTAKGVRPDGSIDLSAGTYVTEEGFEQTARRYRPHAGDIIVTCVGTIGRVAVVPEGVRFSADRNLAAIRVDADKVMPEYVALALRGTGSQLKMAKASSSTAQPHLYLRDLRAITIRVPDLAEQARIGATTAVQIDGINGLGDELERTIRHAASLRRSLLTAAFSGHLSRLSHSEPVVHI
jgi:type I restriction enzyme, S subunit